jgi:hypothetical protein
MDWTLEVVVVPVTSQNDLPGGPAMATGSLKGLQLVVADAYRAREELLSRGVAVGEMQIIDDRDGGTLFGFADPDGNSWIVQQIKGRADNPLLPRQT